jgi:hypothetical protein
MYETHRSREQKLAVGILLPREGERPREPKLFREVRAREDARPPGPAA